MTVKLSDITGFHMTYYMPSDNDEDKNILFSNGVEYMTGQMISIAGIETGKTIGCDIFTASEIDELRDNLYFELKITNLNGEENKYQLQLILTELSF